MNSIYPSPSGKQHKSAGDEGDFTELKKVNTLLCNILGAKEVKKQVGGRKLHNENFKFYALYIMLNADSVNEDEMYSILCLLRVDE